MVTNNRRDFRVRVDIRKNLLADLRMTLHLTPFLERQRARFLEDAGWKPDLPDVMHEPTQVGEILLVLVESHAGRDVPGVDGHGCRMAGCVTVSRVQRGDQSLCEREVRSLQLGIDVLQVVRETPLVL